VKLYVGDRPTFLRFFTFFQISKNMTFYVFLSCCTRFLEHWTQVNGDVWKWWTGTRFILQILSRPTPVSVYAQYDTIYDVTK